jgi:predicted glycogen debranching enzyme
MIDAMSIHLPAWICRDAPAALRREWLVTNGSGGFACGTVAGALTRRYHGLLIAALNPPLGRTLLVSKLDEEVETAGRRSDLATNVWRDGLGQPPGCRFLHRFDLVLGVPTWTYELGGARLVKRVWMEHGRNATFVRYELEAGPAALLACRVLVNYRDYHGLRHGGADRFAVAAAGDRLEIRAFDGATPICVRGVGADLAWRPEHTWWRDFHLPVEAARGFDHLEDHLCAGVAHVRLEPRTPVTFVLAAGADSDVDARGALERCARRAQARLDEWTAQTGLAVGQTPAAVAQLVLAADQFVVARPANRTADTGVGRYNGGADGFTILAGYPWFTDWGRDTMIALPGLTLTTGRNQVARQILRTWARYVDRGLIPNRFPDRGDQPEYHTADATLWYLWAIDQYMRATGDRQTLAELLPVMEDIVAWHRRGTRHNIRVGDDGLVYAGEPGLNLTWMDAKVGDRVITPRIGKPVELSALWYDALCNLARLADRLGRPVGEYRRLAAATRASFQRFWNPQRNCCYDVLDGPAGNDATVRPNQIFAVCLDHSPLSPQQQRAIVDTCEQELLTWFGLRSLAPGEPGYCGRYAGGPAERDAVYHQGTAWGWLLGPFVLAHYRVHRDAARAFDLLAPMLGHVWTHGVGSLSEVFDGDEPHTPGGCPAQAWSVAETLRAWAILGGAARRRP